MSINHAAVDRLIDSMSFTQKVGQLNQRLLGWKSVERNAAGRLVASDELKQEIDRWGGLGTLYGLLRADPWSGQHWGNGIRPEERTEAIAVVQQTVLERGAHGIGVLLSEEAPHGHQALGGTVLPTNLGLGATFDPQGCRKRKPRLPQNWPPAAFISHWYPVWTSPVTHAGAVARNASARIR